MRSSIWAPLAVLLAAAPHVHAQQVDTSSPDRTVKGTIESVMAAIHSDPAARAGDAAKINRIVEQKFLPQTDFMRSTQFAVGSAWEKATPTQRKALFEQFQALLAHTYALQLTQAPDTQFKFPPMAPLAPGATDAVVKTLAISNGDTQPVSYRLHKTDAGWKIYDIDMVGAWMIKVYQQQFAQQLSKGGIDGLIKYIAAHNEQR
jgi:phospholipid transport system substrate-binding protein